MEGPRYEQRKKRRINRMLNIAIGVVVVLILIFGAQLIFGGSSSEQASTSKEDEEQAAEHTVPDPIIKDDQGENINDEGEETSEDDMLDDDEQPDLNEELEPVPDGEWEPVGTEQAGEFSHNFDRSSANWTEMTRALRYATGLDENMIVWRLENGGSPTTARGVVSAPDQQEQPYEVYIEWIDGQGWKPIEKQQLQENPYRRS